MALGTLRQRHHRKEAMAVLRSALEISAQALCAMQVAVAVAQAQSVLPVLQAAMAATAVQEPRMPSPEPVSRMQAVAVADTGIRLRKPRIQVALAVQVGVAAAQAMDLVRLQEPPILVVEVAGWRLKHPRQGIPPQAALASSSCDIRARRVRPAERSRKPTVSPSIRLRRAAR